MGGARARHGRVDVSRVGGRAMRAPSRGGARGRPRGRRASDADHDRGVRGGGEDLRRGGVARVAAARAIAQLVERATVNRKVIGSTPVGRVFR